MRNQGKQKSFSENCKMHLLSKEHLFWDSDWWHTSLLLSFVWSPLLRSWSDITFPYFCVRKRLKSVLGSYVSLVLIFFSFFFFNLYCLKHLELTQQKEEENPGQLYSITELVKRKEKTKIISTVYEYVFLRNYNRK